MALPIAVASFGPSVWNTPASRLAYVAEINRRMLALDDVIRGGHKAGDPLRKQWTPFFRSWQSWMTNTLGGAEQSWLDQLKRKANLLVPYSVVEAAARFDKQWTSFSKKAQQAGIKVPLDPGEPLDPGMDWGGSIKALAVVAVAGVAIVAMLRFAPGTSERLKAKAARKGRELQQRAGAEVRRRIPRRRAA